MNDISPDKDFIIKRGLIDPYTLSDNPDEWVVLSDFIFWSARIQDIVIVPRWMKTDLASIPKIFRSFISVNERHRLPSLPHDFGYSIAGLSHPRSTWDGILKDFCKHQEVPLWKTFTIWGAVRLGGWLIWNKNKDKDVNDMFIPLEHRKWYKKEFPILKLNTNIPNIRI